MASYTTLDQFPDLTPSQRAAAEVLQFGRLAANANGFEYLAQKNPFGLANVLIYQFDGLEGARYDIASSSTRNPDLRIYDQFGNAIAVPKPVDDNYLASGRTWDAVLGWIAPYSGKFYIDAGWRFTSVVEAFLLVYEDLPPNITFRPPQLPVVEDQTWAEGSVVAYTVPAARDPDGHLLTYRAEQGGVQPQLPSWLTFDPVARTFTGTVPAGEADFAVLLYVSDGHWEVSTVFNVRTPGVNRAPVVGAPTPDQQWTEGVAMSVIVPVFTDPDGDRVTYSARQSNGNALPSWLGFDAAARRLQGTPPTNTGDLTIRITATDSKGLSASDDFVLFTPSANRPPALSPEQPALQEWQVGVFASVVDARFADPDGDTLTYAAFQAGNSQGPLRLPLPSWLTINAATGTFEGVPPIGAGGEAIGIRATDSHGAYDEVYFALGVNNNSAATRQTSLNDRIVGTPGNDVVNAFQGDDWIQGGPGADRLVGGLGVDTASYVGVRGDFLLSRDSSGTVTVADKFGVTDTLNGIELIEIGTTTVQTSGITYLPGFTAAPDLLTLFYPGSTRLAFQTANAAERDFLRATDAKYFSADPSALVYRFYNDRDKAFFYTSSAAERDMIIRESTDPAFNPANGLWPYFYQGTTFEQAHSSAGSVPVYRFYNTRTGHHFFTTSASERDMVLRESTEPFFGQPGLWPFIYEGEGFRAFADPNHRDAVQVHRFYSPSLDRHFFTADSGEAAQIRLTGLWNDEGIGFWGEIPG